MGTSFREAAMGGRRISNKQAAWLFFAGLFFVLGPLWGTLGSVVGIADSFDRSLETGVADGGVAAVNIQISLWTTVVGWVMTPLGVLLMLIAVILFFRNIWLKKKAALLDSADTRK